MSSVDFLVKLRDAFQMATDAANEYLETQAPVDARTKTENFNTLKWTVKSGTKSDYEQTTKEANDNNEVFRALQQILSDHKGFWQSSTHKYWSHQGDKNTIDRRKK